jgi:DeoR/GlpR family transcriptional regulator of sugar metabolism
LPVFIVWQENAFISINRDRRMAGPSTEERRHFITQHLLLAKRISARDIAEKFGVSAETVRKDLIRLEKNGLARKSYGGAVVVNESLELGFVEKAARNPSEKAAIAQKAAGFVRDGAVVFLDAGSTVLEVAKQLVLKKGIAVFTNSLKAAQALSDARVRVCIVGGEIKPTSRAAVGGWALRQLSEIRADVAFLGASGFRGRNGPCIENLPESEIKKAMVANAYQSVLVADGSKANQDAMVEYAVWRDFRAVVTDATMPKETLRRIREHTEVVVA